MRDGQCPVTRRKEKKRKSVAQIQMAGSFQIQIWVLDLMQPKLREFKSLGEDFKKYGNVFNRSQIWCSCLWNLEIVTFYLSLSGSFISATDENIWFILSHFAASVLGVEQQSRREFLWKCKEK